MTPIKSTNDTYHNKFLLIDGTKRIAICAGIPVAGHFLSKRSEECIVHAFPPPVSYFLSAFDKTSDMILNPQDIHARSQIGNIDALVVDLGGLYELAGQCKYPCFRLRICHWSLQN